MPRTADDVESYLNRLSRPFERLEDGTFLASAGSNQAPIAIRLADPVVVLRVHIGSAPSGDGPGAAKLFRKLLELNASDLVHVAYALEGDRIILGAALELENLDVNELEAVLAGIDMALAEHVPALRELTK